VTESTKARKGDLILVERVTRNHYSVAAYAEAKAAGRTLLDVETTYEFGVVTSATREGDVKSWQAVGWGDELLGSAQPIRNSRRWVMPAKNIDVERLIAWVKSAHHYPDHPGQPMPFSTFDEAKWFAHFYVIEERAA
jgi:hypothetical protein